MRAIFTPLFILSSFIVWAQPDLRGKALDAETGQPLLSVSVYLNNTSIGTTTNEKGEFIIKGIPPGKYRLVASIEGFEIFSRLINTRESTGDLVISLKPAAKQLASVEVNPSDPEDWETWGKLFTQLFIGTTPNAYECHIRNPDVLKFRMNPDNTLSVYANKPIQLNNNTLGYNISYRLEEFEYNFSTKVVVYNGYALFKDLSPAYPRSARRWEEKRLEVYRGSLLQFMRAYFENKLDSAGFEMRNLGKVVNKQKQRAKLLFAKRKQVIDTVSVDVVTLVQATPPVDGKPPPAPDFSKNVASLDSTDAFKKALLQPDSIISNQLVPAERTRFVVDGTTAGFYFPDSLEVSYKLKDAAFAYRGLSRKHRHEKFPVSQFVFINRIPIYVMGNGFYYGPHDLKVTGYWAWSETMATLLPYDYVPK